jgi:hypothetical protein
MGRMGRSESSLVVWAAVVLLRHLGGVGVAWCGALFEYCFDTHGGVC